MFHNFKCAVQKQFEKMQNNKLFRVELDKEQLWDIYLKSFPEGTNPLFRERTEHDCQCCKNFIRTMGNVVTFIDNKLVSIWDIEIGGFYQIVADALSAYVKAKPIENLFLHYENKVGIDKNFQLKNEVTFTFEHFYLNLPKSLVQREDIISTILAENKSTKNVLLRGLKEITIDSIETTLDLIAQGSLYRGEEHKFAIESFLKLKKEFDKLNENEQDIFTWTNIEVTQSVSRIRNTVIGTLLTDLSEGKDLEIAVKSFEAKVAPTNYKRPTALITKSMIDNARKKIEELGLTSALDRRFAVLEDISINNVLFANRTAKKRMNNVFDMVASQLPDNNKNLDRVEEVSIETFINNILPKAESLEVMFENRHTNNLVSLIAPIDPNAKGLFKWNNNFSWSYAGELTDSIKERVKNAGGKVDGDLRCSLSWFNFDDLDLHMIEPDGYRIYYRNKISNKTKGNLDVDMNAGHGNTRNAIENICYPNKKSMIEGIYKLQVNEFCRRETSDFGFDIEIEFDNKIFSFSYPKLLKLDEYVDIAEIKYTHKNGFEIIKSIPSAQATKQVWGIPTQTFHKVSVMLFSPNHWDEKAVGNKHYFFMLEGCINDGKARGFFNEFLKDELNIHRKVFEVVGSKMKVEESANQLSGIGFSSTQRNHIFCKVQGNFARTIKVIF